jgi:hypothetical protein
MKKQLIIIFSLLLIATNCFAQLNATLTVNRPSSTISEWANNNTTITYIVENISAGGARQVIIKATLKTDDGNTVATTDLSKAQAFTVQNTRIFFAKDVFPIEIMIFNGSYKTTLERTGKLPAGTYQLEVQLVAPSTFAALTSVLTRVFNLVAPQLPYLIMPVNNDSLDAKRSETSIIFRWTPLIPRQQEQPYYRLQVFEVLPFQQPLQALRGNYPVLDQLIRAQTQFIWRPQIPFSTDTTRRKFIWTIQTLDINQRPFVQTNGNGESRSEPNIFHGK